MRLDTLWLALAALATGTGAHAAPRAPDVLTLPLDAPVLDATIDGRPVRLRIDPDASGPVVLSPAAAARLRLVSQGRSLVLVGPVRLAGGTRVAGLAVNGRTVVVQLIWNAWSGAGDAPDIDGTISPGALPYARVRLARPASPGRPAELPMRFSPADGLVGTVSGTGIQLKLAPHRAETLATAAAGARLVQVFGGRLAAADPPTRRIGYGVDRPVAALRLARPLAAAGRSVRTLLVRTADFGDPAGIAAGPDEVVVTGRVGTARLRLTLGADALGGCNVFEWDKTARRMMLDCP